MKTNRYLLLACVIALSACASKVRLDDLPPVTERSTNAAIDGAAINAGGALGTGATGGSTVGGQAGGAGSGVNTTGQGINSTSGSATGSTASASAAMNAIATVNAGSTVKAQPDAGMLAKRSIYFDYDSFSIRDDAKAILQAHAKNLINQRGTKVALEGHTDERGSGEYNLALGQKRANAVQEALQLMGVPNEQMEAVSFGKEKPKATGADEAGYAENRRADIQYK
jgi:peptidoglycan-associated lipoprotein